MKASISELDNIEESQIEDISTLVSWPFLHNQVVFSSTQSAFLILVFCRILQEEEVQEIQQKIDLERKNVEETKAELDRQDALLLDIGQKLQDVRNKIELLTDDSDQLKVRVMCEDIRNTYLIPSVHTVNISMSD